VVDWLKLELDKTCSADGLGFPAHAEAQVAGCHEASRRVGIGFGGYAGTAR
jgi:hypothetical protein